MPSMTRRGALGALVGAVGSVAGCAALGDDDAPPIERSWYADFRDPSSVAVTADGQLLAGSHSPFRDRPIVAGLDAGTGETTWSVTTSKGRKSPIAVADGRAYAVSTAGKIVAVDAAAGDSVWRRELDPFDDEPGVVEFAPLPLGDRVVAPISGTGDGVPDRLLCVARADGERLFTHDLSASLSGAPGALPDGVVAPLLDGRVVRLDRGGSVRWTREVDAALSAVGAADGTVYFGAATEALLALDAATGTVEWRRSLDNTVFTRPLVTDDRVYVGGADYSLRAFDAASGRQLWRDDLDNAVTYGPMRVGDRLVTLVGGPRQIRGPSGAVPFRPVVLYVHDRDGTRRRAVRFDDEQRFEGGGVEWAGAAGGAVYLGQTFGLTRVAPEAIADA
ncbi:PQQ-binding-like beta-propeller repeat protein [Halosimplex pelagicum]|uniref:PQQ-binding-like beta-propeller repeat protein n=1 Tax=Halosimplex pelagicum TaxID=869886 RepID=A0A7D5P467_9EURY|nr:PQQ-binding-like beta-propeller repeat protein [Halosimplex pelagicum]QLH80483.1 PQQ-binding-like beta-propeller repeat protein [Halosimplex pelagicum]